MQGWIKWSLNLYESGSLCSHPALPELSIVKPNAFQKTGQEWGCPQEHLSSRYKTALCMHVSLTQHINSFLSLWVSFYKIYYFINSWAAVMGSFTFGKCAMSFHSSIIAPATMLVLTCSRCSPQEKLAASELITLALYKLLELRKKQ